MNERQVKSEAAQVREIKNLNNWDLLDVAEFGYWMWHRKQWHRQRCGAFDRQQARDKSPNWYTFYYRVCVNELQARNLPVPH